MLRVSRQPKTEKVLEAAEEEGSEIQGLDLKEFIKQERSVGTCDQDLPQAVEVFCKTSDEQ